MKKNLLVLLLFVGSLFAFTQPDDRVFSTKELVWCGIDLSEAKCIGAAGFTNPYEVKNNFFNSWNQLVLNESDKYNIEKFYLKNKVTNDLSVVKVRNDLPNVDELVIEDSYEFKEGQLEKIVKSYKLEKAKEGLGLVYVVESLNKSSEEAVVHVVFFDIASKNILWTKKYNEAPKGFGFRNYWAGAFYRVMKSSEKEYADALKEFQKGNKKS